ncbi:hypothetical protein PPL_05956 [Heterostelium album PN500]|uniref:SUI1 domain-containing protein n=1 Tax=Heterostelium pallidum (strain ATCC 26659 / Pp 5 / PN500) TaxID=670386 RepID=D3BBT7_HETP5|nr:hypothetical protein PPL_05956 [Heterostelium album PN500]EFA81120.1 hypothetical protein PPL_05956 [Heterostelium album PN500]|eukprot:XP_020433238.1 hypothetical protein PPL_05956 [Heterostelium album PN500]
MKNLFKKTFQVGSQSLVRGSDKKKLKEKLVQTYRPNVSIEQLDQVIQNKRDLGLVKLQNQPVQLYCQVGDPLVFEYQGVLYPTTKIPTMLPRIIIHPPVFNYIANGADLMFAGIVNLEDFPDTVGTVVSIVLNGSLSPVAVGYVLPHTQMDRAQVNGKALSIIHYINDALWEYGTKEIDFTIIQQQESESVAATELTTQSMNDLTLNETTTTTTNNNNNEDDDNDTMDTSEDSTTTTTTTSTNGDSIVAVTKEEMDSIVHISFMGAIKFGVIDSELPLPLKTFFNKYMLYYAPADTHEINVNKSSYKKVSKLIDAMKKKKVDRFKRTFTRYKSFELGNIVGDKQQLEEENKEATYGTYDSDSIPLKSVQDVFPLPKSIVDYAKLKELPYKKNLAMEYVKEVIDAKSSTFVLDEVCAPMVKQSGGTSIGKNQFFNQIKQHLSPRFMEIINVQNDIKYLPFKQIEIHSRKISNKFVIEVTGLETFSISPKELAKDGMKAFAASTTLAPFSKTSQMVKIQGNDTDRISKYIQEQYSVPAIYIDIKIDAAVLKKK